MVKKKGLQIDQRVDIALDALSTSQRTVVESALESRKDFDDRAKDPNQTERLSDTKPLFALKAGEGIRIIFSVQGEDVVVEDLMHEATLDRLSPSRTKKHKPSTGGIKSPVKQDQAAKVHKV